MTSCDDEWHVFGGAPERGQPCKCGEVIFTSWNDMIERTFNAKGKE